MSLSTELDREVRERNECPVCDWLERASAEDRQTFTAWVDSGQPAAPLMRACKREGLHVGKDRFYRHLSECRTA